MSTIPKPYRGRRWSVVSNFVARHHIEVALDRPNVFRYAGIIHDRDPETAPHGHVFFELEDARTEDQVANFFECPVVVKPLVGQKGDPHSFARAVRYLTHESPTEQAKGKARYDNSEVFASEGFDWRAAVDALNSRGGQSMSLLDRIKSGILAGTMTPLHVYREYPEVYLKHGTKLRRMQQDHFELKRNEASERYLRQGDAAKASAA